MPFSFANLKADLRPDLWPSGERSNHRPIHEKYFAAACQELQRWVDCLKANNVDLIPFCSTHFHCGLTVFDYDPGAIIKSIKVVDRIDPDTGKSNSDFPIDWCTEITYREVDFCEIETFVAQNKAGCCGSSALSKVFSIPAGYCGKKTFPPPDDEQWNHLNALPMGHHYAQSSTDSECGRALAGVWAKHRGRIYVAPWIESSESIVMEWDGTKQAWNEEDLVPTEPEFKKAVKHFVGMKASKILEKDIRKSQNEQRRYDQALSNLIRDCREENRVRTCRGDDRRSVARAAVIPASVSESGMEETPTLYNQSTCDTISPVVMDPPAGSKILYPTRVFLSCETINADIYFTVDGSTPSADSYKYTGPIEIHSGDVLRAVAYFGGCYSAVTVSAYGPQNKDSAFWRIFNKADTVGKWKQFFGNGVADYAFRLYLMLSAETELKRIDLFPLDENGVWDKSSVWSTAEEISPSELEGDFVNPYPLLLTEDAFALNID